MDTHIRETAIDQVIDIINKGCGGRLVIFKPQDASAKADLELEKRGSYKAIKYHYLSVILIDQTPSVDLVAKDSIANDKDHFLLFSHFDQVSQSIGKSVWLIPDKTFFGLKAGADFSPFLLATENLGKSLFSAM